MKLKKHILIIASFALTITGFSQTGTIKSAAKKYDNFSYIKTSEILEKVAADGYKSVDLFQKLGNSFYFNNKMEDASKWYGELMKLEEAGLATEKIDAEYYYRYSQALKAIENYEEADKWMQKFSNRKSKDLRSKSFLGKRDYLASIENNSESFAVINMDINTATSDFGSNQYKNQLIFASSRSSGKIYKWNEQPFLELHSATKQDDGSYSNVQKFDKSINTKYHESTASFLPTDDVMYFTRNNYTKKRLRRDGKGVNRLKMYRAKLQDDGSWGDVQSIHFNSEDYSVAHPTVNVKGTKLYFASDMPGTYGASDLYAVDIKEDGSLGTPINIGALLNTEAQETFPYINSKGDLYFSSNGLTGLGGLDVFMVRDFETKFEKHEPFVVENVGRPINSSKDDFGYYENLGTKEGFFTSNREGGKGDDDIYEFKIPDCIQDIEGLVFDENTKQLITGATVRLFEESGKELDQIIVGEDGKYVFNGVSCEKEYLIRAEKEDYTTDEERILTSNNKKEKLSLNLEIKTDKIAFEPCDDLAKILDIPIIHFDFDKYKVRNDAQVEMQKVFVVLNEYPTMTIEIRSHTDCRGSVAYNENLSENRAQATKKYLINKGISSSRLTAKGYGESRLVNDCGCEPLNDSDCSEAEHQENRRSEFIITSIDGKTCDEK